MVRTLSTTSSFETNSNNNSTTFSVTVVPPPPVVIPLKNAAVTTTASGLATSKALTPNSAITARELVSAGLVTDVLRQKTLSGLFSFGG